MLREASSGLLALPGAADTDLLRLEWVASSVAAVAGSVAAAVEPVVVAGGDALGLVEDLRASGVQVSSVVDPVDAADQTVLVGVAGRGEAVAATHRLVVAVLDMVQRWLAADADGVLVVVTRGAVAVDGESVVDLAAAGVWGLVRAAQVECPGRLVLVDVDGDRCSVAGLVGVAGWVAAGEGQVVVRAGVVRVGRLVGVGGWSRLPVGDGWRLVARVPGSVDGLEVVGGVEGLRALGAREVRVRVAAAGVNFRDVLNSLGMYPDPDLLLGWEAAGVVVEVGEQVSSLVVGDRVLGLVAGAFAAVGVADERLLVRVPVGWGWSRAAAVPLVWLTAYYGLVELGGLRAGQRVLIHAGAGGVGLAAIGVARVVGAEVFATASVGKWGVLRDWGVAEDHIASSRDTDFEQAFDRVSGGRGMDVVLNSLVGEFVDASVRLLAPGGRFVEMGKTDVRRGEDLPGVWYRAFDLLEVAPEEIARMLAVVVGWLATGRVRGAPVAVWPVLRARQAFRRMSLARHVGKVVLRLPGVWDPDGAVLVTGGTGGLGALVASASGG